MKKLFISVGILISHFLYSQEGYTRIYCKPDLEKCIENLQNLNSWLVYDYDNKKISGKLYDEYHLVIDQTIKSISMVIEDKGQCDTTNAKEIITYTSK